MMKNLKTKFKKITLMLPVALLLIFAAPQVAMAAGTTNAGPFGSSSSKASACTGLQVGTNSSPCSSDSGLTLGHIINIIINIMSIIIGALAVIMIIIAGFKFVTSGGDSTKVASARNTLLYALVGVIVAALGQVLVHYVLNIANNA